MDIFHERPSWLRRLNQFGPATGDPRHIVPLDPGEMLATARSSTGLVEVGDEDWLETYERRIRSIDLESKSNLLGRLLCRAETIRLLQTRLRLCKAWANEPAILEEKIERPIFVLGAPRTGTTILLELLALDRNLRAPISWEAQHPIPHGVAVDPESAMALAEAEHEFWMDIQPELAALHELRSDLPCECVHFMALEFGGPYFAMHYETPSYDQWAMSRPEILPRTYRLHRNFLQTLQYGNERKPWLLKSPAHLMTATALFAEYPDAIAVHTHRDPQRFVGSAASTTAMLHWLRSDDLDPVVYGQLALGGFSYMLNHVMEQRQAGELPNDQFVDSQYLDLIDDPVAAIEKIYDRSGLDWPVGHSDRIHAYLRDKPKGKFGTHRYSLDEYGLNEESVANTYAAYVDYYGISREP
ncbi:MAG: sulfotransferase [bacterium]|nr:hypothetical protein [Deltaproteobacteria bacterium]MCP4907904.1 sulfotransferase [bacterium]